MKSINKKEALKRLRNIILITLGACIIGLILLILAKLGISIPCVFNKITGLYCPGCGNTRAVVSLFHLEFLKAFKYNPLFPVEFFYIVWVYIFASINYIKGSHFSYQTPCKFVDYVVFIIILIWAIVRNII